MMRIFVILIAMLVISCSPKKIETQGPKQPTTMDTVGNIKSIGMMLGCMFAPNDPECEKLKSKKAHKKPHQTLQEYEQENNKEWEKID